MTPRKDDRPCVICFPAWELASGHTRESGRSFEITVASHRRDCKYTREEIGPSELLSMTATAWPGGSSDSSLLKQGRCGEEVAP